MADIKVIIALRAREAVESLWVSLSGNTDFYISLRWLRSRPAFVKQRSGCGSLTLIETDWSSCSESFKRAADMQSCVWLRLISLDGGLVDKCILCLDSEVELEVCMCCLQLRQILRVQYLCDLWGSGADRSVNVRTGHPSWPSYQMFGGFWLGGVVVLCCFLF